MDSNYRRDKPGKSPMGMDLIPVYEESGGGDFGAGTIKISPEVMNNLGVRTALVEKRVLQSQIKTVGYVQYDEDQLIHIHPRIEGWIEKLFVKAIGDPVKKGQPLYEIYSPALVNAQEELLLALERKNGLLIKAAEERLTALQIPDYAIKHLKEKRQVIQNVTFYATQTGVIDNLNIRQGFYVKPGTTLMSIGALDQVWVEAEIFERQVPFIDTGMPVTMTLDYLPGEIWQGRVDYIYPTLNPKTRTVKVRLRFDNRDDLLKPNMFAQVYIHAQSNHESLVVPKEAVIRTGNQDRLVLALEGGRFKSIAVKIGLQDESNMAILSGVNEGERVVTSAQFLIDSESSKTSDFKRMQMIEEPAPAAQVTGTINKINDTNRVINISRGPIEKWDRPAATLDFFIDDDIEIDALKEGASIEFRFEIRNDDFVIVSIESAQSAHDNH